MRQMLPQEARAVSELDRIGRIGQLGGIEAGTRVADDEPAAGGRDFDHDAELAAGKRLAARAVVDQPLVLGGVTFALLAVAGIGWSYSFLRGRSHFEEMLGLAPALGAAAIVLGAFLVDELGMPPGRLGGLVGFVFAAASGVLAASWRMRRTGGGPGRLLEDGATFG